MIGEHTDYNLGFVLPDRAGDGLLCRHRAERTHGDLRVYSRDFEQNADRRCRNCGGAKPQRDWSDYVVGVAGELARAGVPI